MRRERFNRDATRLERREWDRIDAQNVRMRRWDAADNLVEERPADARELAEFAAWEEQNREDTIRTAMANALATNRAFLDKVAAGTATNTDRNQQIAALTRQASALIRLANRQLDATD